MKLLVAAVAFVGGTLLAPELGGKAPLIALFLFALAALLGALLFASMRRSPWPALIALAFILGVLRVALIGDARMPMYASPRSQQVDGVVLSDVEALGDFARFRLGVERIRADGGEWMPADGVLLVSARATSEIAQHGGKRRTSAMAIICELKGASANRQNWTGSTTRHIWRDRASLRFWMRAELR